MTLDFEKLLVIGVIALFLLGPDKLPEYAAKLARLVRQGRRMLDDAKERMRDELGEDFDEEQWRKLDPRQYDPRRIIRDALLEPPEPRAADPDPEPEPIADPLPVAPAAPRAAIVYDAEAT
ncbi:twin-arginine translocase TatA/TatE family subunit [uncultured Amnibacterium sp.]|uniref:twin-arginine translocase TatA/TatE family subunit n=1 Tax=uncultured Amnibacterium sp. TaxID=1631851 RepID=UPI0035CA2F55